MENPAVTTANAHFDDPDVQRLHSRMMQAMAPDDGWEKARYIQWDWMVSRDPEEPIRRSHRWDRYDERFRSEALVSGERMVAIFATDPLAGQVWMDDVLQEGARADSLLQRANGMFVNDSYWLLMPYKWTDPGVVTRYLGEETDEEGMRWEVVRLSFESVGLTPQNVYHAFINPETGLMERWHFLSTADAQPSMVNWAGWRTFGPIKLATERPVGGVSRIYFENVAVDTTVPAGAFAPPGD